MTKKKPEIDISEAARIMGRKGGEVEGDCGCKKKGGFPWKLKV